MQTKDDAVLDCCLFAKQNFTPNVAVLSADRGLQTRARSCGIAVPVYANAEHLLAELQGLSVPTECVFSRVSI